MIDLHIATDDLAKWARHYEQLPNRTKTALARALNTVGEGIVTEAVDKIARNTGLAPNVIRDAIKIHQASPRHLEWSMDATEFAPPSLDWSRPWDRGRQDATATDKQRLVKIVTMDDDKVCVICEEAAENGPYTLEEAQGMLPLHINCRCMMQAWQSLRKLPVVFNESGSPEFLTVKQLGRKVAEELKVTLGTV